jgi:molybdopterin-containing oxidoreductase family iron-sulfur binding subunit
MTRYGVVVDLNRCVGCMTCVISCKEENLTHPGVWWNQILQVEDEGLNRITYVRYACMHCENPPCAKACPNEAVYQRPDGVVLVDKTKCAGVGACAEACPYDVIVMTPPDEYFPGEELPYQAFGETHRTHLPGKASMCTLCYHRIDEGRVPACVAGCPSKAMTFGDLDDPGSPIHAKLGRSEPLQAGAGSKPKVTYVFPDKLKDFIDARVKQDPHMDR